MGLGSSGERTGMVLAGGHGGRTSVRAGRTSGDRTLNWRGWHSIRRGMGVETANMGFSLMKRRVMHGRHLLYCSGGCQGGSCFLHFHSDGVNGRDGWMARRPELLLASGPVGFPYVTTAIP